MLKCTCTLNNYVIVSACTELKLGLTSLDFIFHSLTICVGDEIEHSTSQRVYVCSVHFKTLILGDIFNLKSKV